MKTFIKILVITFIVFTLKGYANEVQMETLWSTDSLVRSGKTMGVDWDEDETNGYLYALLDSNGYDHDHAELYRSTDNGLTWSLWYKNALVNDSSVTNPRVRVVRDANDTSWVCVFGIWCESDGNDELWMRAFRTDDPNRHFEYSVDNYVDYYDIESDKGDSAFIYVTYIKYSNVLFARNNLSGAWQDHIVLFSNPCSDPSPQISTDSKGNVGVCFVDTSQSIGGRDEIRLVRSKDKGWIWLPVQQVGANTGYHGISELDMAYSQDALTQVAWISNTWTVTGNRRVGYYYSIDTAATWNYGGILSGPPSPEQFGCNIRANRITGDLALLYIADYWGKYNIAYTYAPDTNPIGFDDAIFINEDSLSQIAKPSAIVGWTGTNPAIMYVDYGENHVYFDWLANSGIDEHVDNVSLIELDNNIMTLKKVTAKYSILKTGMVKMTLLNVTGQIVRTILNSIQTTGKYEIKIDCEGLCSGIYILYLQTDVGNDYRKITVIK